MIKCFASGRVVNDAKVFTYNTSNGQNTGVNFTIASNRQNSDDAVFIDCTYFNRDENLASYIKQGNQVIVSCDLSIRYDQQSNRNYVSLIVNDFEFGAKKNS